MDKTIKRKIRTAEYVINFIFFGIGMYGLWGVTHSWYALGWCFIASLHINLGKLFEDVDIKESADE